MELNIFMRELESALVRRGVPTETALRHVTNLRKTFTNDDISEIQAIQSTDEIEGLADNICSILNKRAAAARQEDSPVPAPSQQPQSVQPRPRERVMLDERDYDEPRQAPRQNRRNREEKTPDDYFVYSAESTPSTKGMIVFWVGLFLTLPITLAILAVIFGAFAALFAALAALIVAAVVATIGVVAAGAAVSLVAIIFGITQLFSFVTAGIYEIGLGVMVAGAVLFVSVLLYNFAIRFLPWVISKLGIFFGFVCGKLKTLFLYVRRECYKL